MIKGGDLVLFDHPPKGSKTQFYFVMNYRDINGIKCRINANTHMFKHLDTFKDFFTWKTNHGNGPYLSNIYNAYNSGNAGIDVDELQLGEFVNYVSQKLDKMSFDHTRLNPINFNPDNMIEVIDLENKTKTKHFLYSNNNITIRYSNYHVGKFVGFKLISIYAVTDTKIPLYKADKWDIRRGDTHIRPGQPRYIDNPAKAEHVDTAWGIITPPLSPSRPPHKLKPETKITATLSLPKKYMKKGKRKGGTISKKTRHFTKKINHKL